MATTTPHQELPVPQNTDDPNIPEDVTNLALAIEKRLFGVYNSASDRNTKIATPQEGQVAYHRDTNSMHYYDGAAWVQFYPVVLPAFTSGTNVPSNGTGADGDVYFRV